MRITAVVFIVLLCAAPASAQYGGLIGLYSDPGYIDCNLAEQVDAPNTVYVVHTNAAEAAASQFRVDLHWNAPFVGADYQDNVKVGDIFAGVAVAYEGCQALPHLIVALNFFTSFSSTPPCIAMEVVPDPNAEPFVGTEIVAIDCSRNALIGNGGILCVNLPTCCIASTGSPGSSGVLPWCDTVPVETTTWGAVKALYR
jgi:hypothetical protein